MKFNWDAVGIATSLLCAIHCTMLPLLISSLPLFGINLVHNAFFEWGMIALAFLVGGYALYHGYIRHHRAPLPVVLFSIGFLLLLLKQFFHNIQSLLLLPAVLLIISAHYTNYRLCRQSKCSSPHHSH